MKSNNKPVDHVALGDIEATLWKNTSSKGTPYFTVTFSRKYRDTSGTLKATSSFRRSELLALASLATTVATDLAALELRMKNIGPDAVSTDSQGTEPTPVVTLTPKAA